jgi:hypothetical protein
MSVDSDRIDKVIEDTRERIERMKELTTKTQALLASHGQMSDASDIMQAEDAAKEGESAKA